MEPLWDYDATIRAFTDPSAARDFFAGPGPHPDSVLCAELAQLAFSHDRAFVSAMLNRAGFRGHEWFHGAGTDALLVQGKDTVVLAFRGTEPPSLRRLVEGSRFQALFQGHGRWRDRLGGLFRGSGPDRSALIDRISAEMQDIVTDLNAIPTSWRAGGRVHRGFALALNGIWESIAPAIAQVEGRVLYTGCSLGAALAILAASLHAPHAVYAFGPPMLGDKGFAATLGGVEIHRYVNCCDIACRLPPGLYAPLGMLCYIDRFGDIGQIEETESQRNAARLAHLKRYIGQWDKIWVRDISDHAPENYRRAVLRQVGARLQSAL